jgi:hypothetical protein
VHEFITALDRHWHYNAALVSFGASQRWITVAKGLKNDGWAVRGTQARWNGFRWAG